MTRHRPTHSGARIAYYYYIRRLMRITDRESRKAYTDAIINGIGFTKINDSGEIQHIPYVDMWANHDEQSQN